VECTGWSKAGCEHLRASICVHADQLDRLHGKHAAARDIMNQQLTCTCSACSAKSSYACTRTVATQRSVPWKEIGYRLCHACLCTVMTVHLDLAQAQCPGRVQSRSSRLGTLNLDNSFLAAVCHGASPAHTCTMYILICNTRCESWKTNTTSSDPTRWGILCTGDRGVWWHTRNVAGGTAGAMGDKLCTGCTDPAYEPAQLVSSPALIWGHRCRTCVAGQMADSRSHRG
jgi:hypothetical protein